MTKSFNLEWSELPEWLREQKIDEYLKSDIDSFRVRLAEDKVERDESLDVDLLVGKINDFEVLGYLRFREEAEQGIEARFPMYF